MRMLVLVTGQTVPAIAARRGDYPAWIADKTGDAWPGTWDVHDVRTSARLPGPRDADGFVITGSSSSVTERARTPWMPRAEALVRAIAASGRPLLGICFGHQLAAQALGGRVTKNPRGREIGTMRVHRVADGALFAGLPRDFDIHGTHMDVVSALPKGGERLATTPLDPIAAFRVGSSIWGVQFHPEFDADVMRGYLQARADAIRDEGGSVDALMARVNAPTAGGVIMRNFARMVERSSSSDRPRP